jgi:hypothetical protein
MIEFSIETINPQRVVSNYSIEEINIVVDSSFLSTSHKFKWDL